MKVEWSDNTSRSLSTGEPLEMIEERAEIGPFTLWARQDGYWEVSFQVENGLHGEWFPPSAHANDGVDSMGQAKQAAERGLQEYIERLVRYCRPPASRTCRS
jgi:hypothetical protein